MFVVKSHRGNDMRPDGSKTKICSRAAYWRPEFFLHSITMKSPVHRTSPHNRCYIWCFVEPLNHCMRLQSLHSQWLNCTFSWLLSSLIYNRTANFKTQQGFWASCILRFMQHRHLKPQIHNKLLGMRAPCTFHKIKKSQGLYLQGCERLT